MNVQAERLKTFDELTQDQRDARLNHRRRYRPKANARRFWSKRVAEFARKHPSGPKSQPYEFRVTGYWVLNTSGPARHPSASGL